MNALEARIARIRTESADILNTSGLLEALRQNSACWTSPAFDVRMAIKDLREAVTKLESICEHAKD